jgi:hypothetical protein
MNIEVVHDKNFKKKYINGKIKTKPIEAFSCFFPEFFGRKKHETENDFKQSLKRNHLIYADNRKFFEKIFGKKLFVFKSSFNFHCWLLHYENFQIIILTAKEKGTCIEIVIDEKE